MLAHNDITATAEDLKTDHKHSCLDDTSSGDDEAWSALTRNKRGFNDIIDDLDLEDLLLYSERLQKRIKEK